MNAIFDYSGKSTEWLHMIIEKIGMFSEALREKVLKSALAELDRRGETE